MGYTLSVLKRLGIEPDGPSRTTWLVAAAAASCFLALFAQVAATPVGEGMDVDGHLAYVVFLVREGRPPLTGEPSVPADVAGLREHCLASDYVCPGSYRRWAGLSSAERDAERRAWLTPKPDAPYVSENYEAQHPPLYYLVLSPLARLARRLPYDRQLFWYGATSAVFAASAVPALWLLFRRRFGAGPSLALVTAVAWFPNLMPFLGRLTNDALAFPLVCWFLAVVDRPRLARRDVVAGAVLLVAGLLTKSYFLTLVPAFLALCFFRGGEGRTSPRMLVLGAAVLAAGAVPLLAANYATTGLAIPVLEARLTAGEPLWRKVSGLFMVDWVLFLALMARGLFWSGYWSWVAPGPWYYLPLLAPAALLLPWPRATAHGAGGAWWRAAASDAWVHLLGWGVFLLAMWWHAGLLALDASVRHRAQFLGGEGWYLNVLVASTATIVAVAVRERYGVKPLGSILLAAAGASIAWNLAARATLYAFWGGGVGLWSGLRFARSADVLRALGNPGTWSAWQSWPGVVGPAWLTQAVPLALALALSLGVLAYSRPLRDLPAPPASR